MGKFAATVPEAPPKMCPVGQLLETVDKEDRAAIVAVLANPDVSVAKILDWFRENGVAMNKDTPAKHRAGKCRCVA